MNTQNISDITFIGSGISTTFSIIHFLDLIDNETSLNNKISINIIEKYSEFNLGIPYGSRSGFSTLLITSLKNFLPEPELSLFIDWLNKNKTWLLNEFEKEGGVLSKKWLVDNKDKIRDNKWKKLFIPRRFFGCYVDSKIKNKLEKLTKKGFISVNYINNEVVDIQEINNFYEISLVNNSKISSKKVVLSTGSLPVKHLWQNKDLIEEKNMIFINTPYKPELGVVLHKIKKFISNRVNERTNILIVGANASALELIYKINDNSLKENNNTDFTFLSTQGKIPDSIIDKKGRKEFIPKYLNELGKEKKLNAKLIAEAITKDLDRADEIKLGSASTVKIISKYFCGLLQTLDSNELEIFACKYGNEIGKRQRCAGEHYTNIVTCLEKLNRFEHISGRFKDMIYDNGNYNLSYIDTSTEKEKLHNKHFHIVINCIGGKNLNEEDIPTLHKNLISKNYCKPNQSKIGFHVNESLEAKRDLHIMGPMLAGNVIENSAIWHVEHCGRIIRLSKTLSKVIFNDLVDNKIHTQKKYELEINDLENDSDIKKYSNILEKKWNNNLYYVFDHLKNFKKDLSSLKYFLFKINDSSEILMPIVLMPIILKGKQLDYFDAITPYGYSGPLYHNNVTELDLKKFWKLVDEWYKKNNVITEFIRFSLNQNYLGYSGLLISSLFNVKGTLYNDFVKQWDSFLPKVRNNYRKAISFNLNIKLFCRTVINDDIIKIFYDIYTETMIRNNAKNIYFFSLSYFKNLINNNINQFLIAVVYFDKTPISTELIIKNNNTLFAFLGGTNANFFHCRPNDYLRVEIIKWAIDNNYKHYILGGGLKDGDGLYKSKKSFFPKNEDILFFTGRKIINHKVYNKLINQIKPDCDDVDGLIQNSDAFFPLYRSNNYKNMPPFSFDIITTKKDWNNALLKVENYDFYHTYDYHHISKEKHEKALLLKYSEGNKIICLPIILRKILGTDYNDATSVYGYSGPLQKNIDKSFDNSNFIKELNSFFQDYKIISVFSRLNPFIQNQQTILNNFGKVVKIGNIVNIDITKNIDSQRTIFSKTTKRYLNKANKLLDVKISKNEKDIKAFKNLYYENMDRVKAKGMYYFSEEYFHELINSPDYDTDVLFAIDRESNEIISAAIMIKTNNIIQYHISGTKTAFLHLSPIRLLIDKMRIKGTEENYTYFNLGGGLGNSEDELFRFKSSFSKDLKSFKVWKYIANQEIYNKLVQKKAADSNSSFFPLYRSI